MAIIGLDVDDVVLDLITFWLEIYRSRTGHQIFPEDITDWDLSQFVKPEFKDLFFSFIETPLIYDFVQPISGALETYNYLKKSGHDIVFVTNATQGCAGRKYQWLIDHGYDVSRDNYIECKRKELVNVDFLIDDNYENVALTPGVGILWSAPWNRKYKWYLRANNWKYVISIIEGKAGFAE